MSETKCCQITEKKNGFFFKSEECGVNAKFQLTYTLRNEKVSKTLCKRHLNSNVSWLDKIKTEYSITEK